MRVRGMIEGLPCFFTPVERRYKVLSVSSELLGDCLANFRISEDSKMVLGVRIDGIPEGCMVQAIVYDPMRMMVNFRLYHPSFDVVGDCDFIPVLEVKFTRVEFKVLERYDTPTVVEVASGCSN